MIDLLKRVRRNVACPLHLPFQPAFYFRLALCQPFQVLHGILAHTGMEVSTQCVVALQLCEHASEVDDVNGLLQLLEHSFVTVFKWDALKSGTPPWGSKEEEKLILIRAITSLHTTGCPRHQAFFASEEYFNHAALFIHELLHSLSGNTKDWFRTLQVEALKACQAILRVLPLESVRRCFPGIASATIRYMKRAHHGKDGASVRLLAIDLLHQCILVVFSPALVDEHRQWTMTSAQHLAQSLGTVVSPTTILSKHYEFRALCKWKKLLRDLLCAPSLCPMEHHMLFREAISSYLVVDNMCHLQSLDVPTDGAEVTVDDGEGDLPSASGSSIGSVAHFRSLKSVLSTPAAQQYIQELLTTLRAVPMLHAATAVLRAPALRHILICCGGPDDKSELLRFVVRKAIRLVEHEMAPEELYTSRRPRRYPAGVVDEFLETLAHALAEIPHESVEDSTAGETLTNMILEESQAVLDDWEAYTVHPATVYVASRLIIWQFKPIPDYLAAYFSSECSEFPQPIDFIECAVLEQLWSVIALPHLWNIQEDEELCSYQQLNHRRLMAAAILRALDLVAADVMKRVLQIEGGCSETQEASRRAFDRLCVLTLYPIMEKASVAGFLHDCAMNCLSRYAAASGETEPLGFFTRIGDFVVDDASRSMNERFLRSSATNVLMGCIHFLMFSISTYGDEQQPHSNVEEVPNYFFSTSPLPQLVRHRLSPSAVQSALHRTRVNPLYITKTAQFMAPLLEIVRKSTLQAYTEGDDDGAKSLLRLLCDALDVAVVLNFSSPLEVVRDEDAADHLTTSANESVKILQCAALDCIRMLQTHAMKSHASITLAVRTIIHGISGFLSTVNAKEALGDSSPTEGGYFVRPPTKVVEWFPDPAAELPAGFITLPRSMLTTVYQTYVSLLSLVKEPIANFLSSPNAGCHTRSEQRQLRSVAFNDSFFAGLNGLYALLLLSVDFLQHRYVTEVLPAALVWYERSIIPPIASASELRGKQLLDDFIETLRKHCTDVEAIRTSLDAVVKNAAAHQLKRSTLEASYPRKSGKGQLSFSSSACVTREDWFIEVPTPSAAKDKPAIRLS